MERSWTLAPNILAAVASAIALGLLTSGCVSVNLAGGKIEKSSGVTFAKPEGGFTEFENSRADAAWKNKSTGSTIAYQSTCGESADVPLESIADDVLNSFEDHKEVRRTRKPFDGRESVDAEVEGRVDGVLTISRSIIYKKNKCSYVLTLISLPASFKADGVQFDRFTMSFKAP